MPVVPIGPVSLPPGRPQGAWLDPLLFLLLLPVLLDLPLPEMMPDWPSPVMLLASLVIGVAALLRTALVAWRFAMREHRLHLTEDDGDPR